MIPRIPALLVVSVLAAVGCEGKEAPVQAMRPAEVRALVEAPGSVEFTTVAALLGDGTEACIDGRADRPVLGTPGGDVGEILVALAALEQTAGEHVREDALASLFDDYHESFGRLYLHSDDGAMGRLVASLRKDPRLAHRAPLGAPASALKYLLRPPREDQEIILEHLVRPEHIGCGHLRLVVEQSSTYGVRPELAKLVLAHAFRLEWRRPGSLEFVVLHGEHHEKAVLEVRADGPVHAHTRVPLIAPHMAGHEVFVHHPEVAAFVRRETGTFFVEHADELVKSPPNEDKYLHVLDNFADKQLRATLKHLAPHLPVVEVHARDVARATGHLH